MKIQMLRAARVTREDFPLTGIISDFSCEESRNKNVKYKHRFLRILGKPELN
jgi:hypothetical protein